MVPAFLLPRSIPQCAYTTLRLHSPTGGRFGLLPTKLLCTRVRTHAFISLADMPRSVVAGPTRGGRLHFEEAARLSSQVATPHYPPSSSASVPPRTSSCGQSFHPGPWSQWAMRSHCGFKGQSQRAHGLIDFCRCTVRTPRLDSQAPPASRPLVCSAPAHRWRPGEWGAE